MPAGIAVAAQVGAYDGAALGQGRGHPVPHHMALRIAVQQQQRRPRAADPGADRGLAGRDVPQLEPLKHHARLPVVALQHPCAKKAMSVAKLQCCIAKVRLPFVPSRTHMAV
jgi:hypothetical protein